jgi:hypothetical protein
MTVTLSLYSRLVNDRPFKLDEDEVSYRKSDREEVCHTCIHFFTRVADSFHTCEIFRPQNDESVRPDWVCDFWSEDGKKFPILDKEMPDED